MIEFYDTIQFAFGRVHPGIMTKSKILHLDLDGLGLSLFANFKLYFFCLSSSFHILIFLKIELHLFLFSFRGVFI
jgi:hypothetical protein